MSSAVAGIYIWSPVRDMNSGRDHWGFIRILSGLELRIFIDNAKIMLR